MRDRLIELLSNCQHEYDKEVISACAENRPFKKENAFYADFLLANGVIAPPCKVGDTVYVIFSQFKTDINKCRVDEFLIREREIFAVLDVHYPNYIARRKTSIPISWFNRFAFTTQEAAEQAMKRGVWE